MYFVCFKIFKLTIDDLKIEKLELKTMIWVLTNDVIIYINLKKIH
jgi:hypothetical protein